MRLPTNGLFPVRDASRLRRAQSRRRLAWLAAIFFVVGLPGCLNEMIAIGYMIGGPPSIEPKFDKLTKESMTDHGVTVAVVCYAPQQIQWDVAGIDRQIEKFVSFRLVQKKIKVVSPDRVRAWLDENNHWDNPQDIGAALGVTYVIYIDLHHFSLYEPHSSNFYRGQAEAVVSVTKMDENGEGERIFSEELTSKYPLSVPRSTFEISYENFLREYLARLSEDIGRFFYEYYSGDDMPDAT